jgi:hypothetical protein
VRAPFLLGIIDVIAIPRLTLFFGARLMHFGACATAKGCREENKRAANFPAGEYVLHIFLVPDVGNLFSAISGLGTLLWNRPALGGDEPLIPINILSSGIPKTTPHEIVFNESLKEVLTSDPVWNDGVYDAPSVRVYIRKEGDNGMPAAFK